MAAAQPVHPNGGGSGSPPNPALAPQITSNLYLSDTVATKSHLLLFTHHISTIINVSLEVVNTLCPNIKYPVMDAPDALISSCFNSVAAKIHSVGTHTGQMLLHCAARHCSTSLAGAHARVEFYHPIVQPNNGFWHQLIHYEYKLFSINRL
ncbi:dual specificity protein phosphatase 18 [Morus bassanus]